jgi:hypothetical protein
MESYELNSEGAVVGEFTKPLTTEVTKGEIAGLQRPDIDGDYMYIRGNAAG